jgi:hypothetical protein
MDWVAVILWGLVAGLSLPIGAGALMGAAPLGIAPLAGGGGLVLTVLFIAVGGVGFAWAAFALAALGVVCVLAGAAQLTDDRRTVVAMAGPSDDTVALLCGVAIPLFLVQAAIALPVAIS